VNVAPFRAETGHLICPTLPVNGWWLVEDAPGSDIFLFGFQEEALAIMREHNRLWAAKHGAEAVAEQDAMHARVCERVREFNRERGFTDDEIDAEFEAAARRYAGKSTGTSQQMLL